MSALLRVAVASLALLLAACATSPNGPPYPQRAASAPPIAPGQARLIVYRTLYTQIQTLHPPVTVDGTPVGVLPEGTYLWLEEPAGFHVLMSPEVKRVEAFGAQLPTTPLSLELAPGSTTYVLLDVEAGTGQVIVSFTQVDPGRAMTDLPTLEQAPPSETP